jgi:Sad1 / UNC-like C-terminal
MTRAGRDCLFLAAVAVLLLPGAYPPAAAALSSSSPPAAAHVCQSRTINYITHTLPQQCLKTGWAGSTALALDEEPGADSGAVVAGAATQDTVLGAAGPNSALGVHPRDPGEETAAPAALTSADATTTSTEPPQVASLQASSPTGTVENIDQETEALLDGAHFLSFEEWKKQNLERVGQSGENIGDRRQGHREHRRRPGIDNVLDSLGDDSEIELDFGSFVSGESGTDEPSPWSTPTRGADGHVGKTSHPDGGDSVRAPVGSKPKDAGKAYAERFNYASFDCAATVLKTNPECKASSSILVENKDSYMLNECGAKNKFFIVELCNDILVDTIVLANFEFFSSMFRSFRVSVSDRYPTTAPDRWRELGVFEARNSRGVQAFVVRNSLIWARYLRVEFLTHYGNEFYCPVSLLRVHGTTMIEELRREEESAQEAELEIEGSVKDTTVTENATPDMQNMASGGAQEPLDQMPSAQASPTSENLKEAEDMSGGPAAVSTDEREMSTCDQQFIAELEQLFWPFNISDYLVCKLDGDREKEQTSPYYQANVGPRTSHEDISATRTPTVISQAPPPPATPKEPVLAPGKPAQAPKASDTTKDATLSTATEVTTTVADNTSQDSRNLQASTTSSPPASPTTQESFFKTIHKRLQLLEANATLSLQYIEEQSRILRDAFVKIEKRQLTKTTNFLENLNATVLNELRSFVSASLNYRPKGSRIPN